MRISFSYVFDSYNVNYRAFVRLWKVSGSHTITNPAHLFCLLVHPLLGRWFLVVRGKPLFRVPPTFLPNKENDGENTSFLVGVNCTNYQLSSNPPH